MKRFYVILAMTLVVLIATIVVYMQTRRYHLDMMAMEKGFSDMERVVSTHRPETISREDVRSAFSQGLEKIKKGEADLEALEALIATFQEAIGDETLDSLEVVKILGALERL